MMFAGLAIGRLGVSENSTPVDFTPVYITPIANHDPSPKPPQKPTPKPDNTTRNFLQITPTPRDISDDNGGRTSDTTSDTTGDDTGGSVDTGDTSGSGDSGDSTGSDSTDHD